MVPAFLKTLVRRNHTKVSRADRKLLAGIDAYEKALDSYCLNPSSERAHAVADNRFKELEPLVRNHEFPLLKHPDGLRVLRELTEDNQRHLLTPERSASLLQGIEQLGGKESSALHPTQQAQRDLKALYHRRYRAVTHAEDTMNKFLDAVNGKRRSHYIEDGFRPAEIESMNVQSLRKHLGALEKVEIGQKGYEEAHALIPHLQEVLETRRGEDALRERFRKLLSKNTNIRDEMDKIWNGVTAEQGWREAAQAEKAAVIATETAAPAISKYIAGGTKKAAPTSGHGKWIAGGAVAAVAIGAFLCRDKTKNHADRENIRRTTLNTGQELS